MFPVQLSRVLTAALLVFAMAATCWSLPNERSTVSEPYVVIDVFGLPLQPMKDDDHYALTNYLGRLSKAEVSRVLEAIQEHAEHRKNTPQGGPAPYEPTACWLVIRNGTSDVREVWDVGQGWACRVHSGRVAGKSRVVVNCSYADGHIFAKSRLNAVVEAFIGRFDPALPKASKKFRSYFEDTPASAGEKK